MILRLKGNSYISKFYMFQVSSGNHSKRFNVENKGDNDFYLTQVIF